MLITAFLLFTAAASFILGWFARDVSTAQTAPTADLDAAFRRLTLAAVSVIAIFALMLLVLFGKS